MHYLSVRGCLQTVAKVIFEGRGQRSMLFSPVGPIMETRNKVSALNVG